MSRIDELIEKLCPDGVDFQELGQVLKTLKKGTLKTTELIINGTYPVINSGRGIYGRYNEFNNEGNVITIAARGENAGFINYFDERFWAGGLCYPYNSFDEKTITTKFIFYYLKYKQNYIRNRLVAEGGIPALNKSEIEKFQIPVPPLAIQEKIVEILDKFTQLETELETELEARKAQYQFYRNRLLAFENKEVEWKTLGEVGTFTRGNGLPKTDFTETGIGCIHYGQIYTYYGNSATKTKSFVSQETALKLKKVKKGDIIITNTSENYEDVCKAVVWLGDEEIVTGGHACVFKHSENSKYIAYYTQTNEFTISKRKFAKGTKVIDVSAKDLAKIEIPVPPLAEQNRIVKILDQFDDLVNNISSGLPAEIKARRQQYEFYREKLLIFKVMENH